MALRWPKSGPFFHLKMVLPSRRNAHFQKNWCSRRGETLVFRRKSGVLVEAQRPFPHLEFIFGDLGGILGSLGVSLVILRASWVILGRLRRILGYLGPSWRHLGGIFGPSWAILGHPGGLKMVLPSRRNVHFHILGLCLIVLGALGGILGHLGGVFG